NAEAGFGLGSYGNRIENLEIRSNVIAPVTRSDPGSHLPLQNLQRMLHRGEQGFRLGCVLMPRLQEGDQLPLPSDASFGNEDAAVVAGGQGAAPLSVPRRRRSRSLCRSRSPLRTSSTTRIAIASRAALSPLSRSAVQTSSTA